MSDCELVVGDQLQGVAADEPMLWYQGAGLSDRHWLHADERGSIVSLMDDSGNAVAINSYDEYGIPGSANIGRFQYTGQMYLPEIGLYYYKARMYSTTLGRFMQTDPIGYGDGMNWYAYTHNDPVNGKDPSGNGDEPSQEQLDQLIAQSNASQMQNGLSSSLALGQSNLGDSIANGVLESEIADEVDFEAQSNMAEIAAYHAAEDACSCDLSQPGLESQVAKLRPLTSSEAQLMKILFSLTRFRDEVIQSWVETMQTGLEHGFFILRREGSFYSSGIFTGIWVDNGTPTATMGRDWVDAAKYFNDNGGIWATFHTHPSADPTAFVPSCCGPNTDMQFYQDTHSIGIIMTRQNGATIIYGH